VGHIERAYYDRVLTQEEFEENEHLIAEVARLSVTSTSPLARLERALSPWVAYVIVPTFALANAGVTLSAETLGDLASDPVTLGVGLGLVVGKTVGVFGATVVAVKLGIGRLPTGTTWRHLFGLAICAGIGFTVALFVTSISLTDPALADAAKVGILFGSLLAGTLGYTFMRTIPEPEASLEPNVGPEGTTGTARSIQPLDAPARQAATAPRSEPVAVTTAPASR
jgi:NhaA family Na+:H+ antiporter